MLTFRDTIEHFKLDGDLLKTMRIFQLNVDHSNPQVRKIIHGLRKEMNFDFKQKGGPSNRDSSLITLLNSPANHGFGNLNNNFNI